MQLSQSQQFMDLLRSPFGIVGIIVAILVAGLISTTKARWPVLVVMAALIWTSSLSRSSSMEGFSLARPLEQIDTLGRSLTLAGLMTDASLAFTKGSGHQMLPFAGGYFTNGYVITRAGARALVKFLYPVGDVADCWKRIQQHRVIDLYAVTPPLALQNREAFGSMTSAEIRKFLKGRAWWWKYPFKARRAFWLGVDHFLAFFDRHFRPYAGLDLKRKRAKPGSGPGAG